MFSDLSGSFREIVAAVAACKAGWIDSGNGNGLTGGVEQVQSFSEGEPELEGFYPAKKFLKRGEMRNYRELKYLPNILHITNILNKFPIMLVPVFLEENKDKKLMLGVELFRIFAGIQIEMGWFYHRNGCLDKPDIPACWFLYCLLTLCAHIVVRRQCTLDLSVVSTFCFKKDFYRAKKFSILHLFQPQNFRIERFYQLFNL